MLAQNYRDLIHWADGLSAVMAERNRNDLVTQIDEAKAALASNTFTLAVLGKAKRGKSTLINALLGRTDDLLAPVDKLPASSAITRFRYGDDESAVVFFQNGNKEAITYARVREFVTEELNPGNRKEVATVEIVGPFPNLPPQVEIVDTPGAGSIHEHHDALLHAFIPQADAVIFLVTARMPLDQEELNLLQEVKKQDVKKIFFVINKIDDSDSDEIESAIAHNSRLLAQCGITPEGFHKISAKHAFLGKPESYVSDLSDNLGRFLHQHKGAVIRQRFLSRVSGVVEPELRAIEVTYSSSRKTGAELDADLAALQQEKRTIGNKREFQEKEFDRKWKNAVTDLESKLSLAEKNVAAAVTEKINDTTTFQVGKLVKELPTFINHKISEELTPLTERFETAVRTACDELNEEYPILHSDETGRIAFKSQRDLTAVKGLVAGGAVAAGGIGIASAGAATAASIATVNLGVIGAAKAATLSGLLASAGNLALGVFGLPPFLAAGSVTATTLATPLWVVLAGPVGWTLAGVGALAVPFSWRVSKLKQKDKLEEAASQQVKEIFQQIRGERIKGLRQMGNSILEGFRNNLDRKISELEEALLAVKTNRPGESGLALLKQQSEVLSQLMLQSAEWLET